MMKPPGMTSFDAVAWIRRLTGVKKAGHCGTLDPDAAGVLPLCVGAATGVAGYLTDAGKAYRVEAIPGILTDTLDAAGTVLDEKICDMPDRGEFETALESFAGISYQTPPMYSAVKIGGERLYKLARRGVTDLTVKPAPRKVGIYSLKIAYYAKDRVIFDVDCSKGTYIRSLCRDIGEKLGIYLCMSFLLRTMSAGLHIRDSLTIGEVEERVRESSMDEVIIPADSLLGGYPKAILPETVYNRYKNGVAVYAHYNRGSGEYNFTGCAAAADGTPSAVGGEITRVYRDGAFIGLGVTDNRDGMVTLRSKKFLIEPERR